jgi:hypothetical protein
MLKNWKMVSIYIFCQKQGNILKTVKIVQITRF